MSHTFTVLALWFTGAALMGAEVVADRHPSRPTPAAVELTISGAQRWLLAQQQLRGKPRSTAVASTRVSFTVPFNPRISLTRRVAEFMPMLHTALDQHRLT